MEEEGIIALNVRRRMRAKSLSPKTLSLKAGLNETYVRDLLKGRSLNPRQAHLQLLALALDCSVSDLTGEQVTDEATRELLAAFQSTDEQGREMLLRLARSLRGVSPAEPSDRQRAAPHSAGGVPMSRARARGH